MIRGHVIATHSHAGTRRYWTAEVLYFDVDRPADHPPILLASEDFTFDPIGLCEAHSWATRMTANHWIASKEPLLAKPWKIGNPGKFPTIVAECPSCHRAGIVQCTAYSLSAFAGDRATLHPTLVHPGHPDDCHRVWRTVIELRDGINVHR